MLLLDLIHLLLVLRPQLVHLAALLDNLGAQVIFNLVVLLQGGYLFQKIVYLAARQDQELFECLVSCILIAISIDLIGSFLRSVDQLILQNLDFVIQRYLNLVAFLLDLHIVVFQLLYFLLVHLTLLIQLRILLLLRTYLRLQDLYIVLGKLQLRLGLSEVVILLIDFFQDVVPILVQTLEPSDFFLELLDLHLLHAIGLVGVVIALVAAMILLQFLHVLLQLLYLLVFLVELVLFLLDVEFEFFSLLL